MVDTSILPRDLAVEDHNALSRERTLQRYRTVRDAFVAVFGPPGQRTPHGKIILDELEKFTNWTKLVREQDTTGQTDIYRTGIKEGRREVMQAIHNLIEWKESDHVNTSV
jgi:hypothetical protein